jgi:hypothetical protein
LTPQYKEAEDRYRAAETSAEKLAALEDMLTIIPKHKGTEHMQADIKRRISKLKESDEKKGAHSKRGAEYNVEKEGGGQVVLVGAPNAGKSQLMSRITNAQPEIGQYPFTTQKPQPGMMEYEDIHIQIVDLPPITEEFTEAWMAAIARNSDAVLFVIDASDGDVLDQMETTLRVLERFRLTLYGWGRSEPSPSGDESRLMFTRKALLVANKMDGPDAADNMAVVREFNGDRFPIVEVSSVTGQGLEELKTEIFRMLDVVRVYTKIPGKPADAKTPFVLPRGSTVQDLTVTIHKDFAQKFRFARIWGTKKFDGQMVSRDYIIEDRDVIELHV